jgi:hypothetical protein
LSKIAEHAGTKALIEVLDAEIQKSCQREESQAKDNGNSTGAVKPKAFPFGGGKEVKKIVERLEELSHQSGPAHPDYCYIAALLLKQGLISWRKLFLQLSPDLELLFDLCQKRCQLQSELVSSKTVPLMKQN